MEDKPKSKINKNAKRIFYLLVILFITLYFANQTGYYESRMQSKTNLTKEAIERFEKDVADFVAAFGSEVVTDPEEEEELGTG